MFYRLVREEFVDAVRRLGNCAIFTWFFWDDVRMFLDFYYVVDYRDVHEVARIFSVESYEWANEGRASYELEAVFWCTVYRVFAVSYVEGYFA